MGFIYSLRQVPPVEQGAVSHRSVLPQQVAPGAGVSILIMYEAEISLSRFSLPQSGQRVA